MTACCPPLSWSSHACGLEFDVGGVWSGESDCAIPEPETEGTLSLSFGGGPVDQLSLLAVQKDAFDFTFVSFGDNDDIDCSHEEFTFIVVAPVLSQ